jgi:heterokaryon incompatibility protein (HET)
MRLLQLKGHDRFSLTQFPKGNIPPYAILSHTWGGENDEVTLKDLENGSGRDKKGYQKLLFCGNQATADNLHYFWVDTCCIDKSNEKELTTAINSMFRWYQTAARCYVYLSDVSVLVQDSQSRYINEWESAFRNSRWFTRGWTLQELLAPKTVLFYSRDHVRLGDKQSLEQQIRKITGIAVEALQGGYLGNFDVDERLRWAEERQTTEEEDKAYCLLGIFDVSLPLVYGEGYTKAMNRLLRQVKDSIQDVSQLESKSVMAYIGLWFTSSH